MEEEAGGSVAAVAAAVDIAAVAAADVVVVAAADTAVDIVAAVECKIMVRETVLLQACRQPPLGHPLSTHCETQRPVADD